MIKQKLSTIIKFNNWEKLNDMYSLINNKNYIMLLCTSIKYHSKECFDILISHPKNKDYINTLSSYHYITLVFENYINGPNKSNEYYIEKVFPELALINSYSMNYIIQNTNLFAKIYNNIIKSELSLNYLLCQICMNNSIDIFNNVFNHIKNNQNHFPFFNNNWVNKIILYNCLIFDNVEVLKVLDNFGYNIDYVLTGNIKISSLVLSLSDIDNKMYDLKCFKYLITKTTTEQNLLWSVHLNLKHFNYCNHFYKLTTNWDFNYDKFKELDPINNMVDLEEPYYNLELTNENLGLAMLNEDDFNNGFIDIYNFERSINILYSLIQTQTQTPNLKIKKYLENINKIPNIDIIDQISFYLCIIIQNISIIKRKLKRKNKLDKLIKILKIIAYFKTNKLSTYNPIIKINEYIQPKTKTLIKNIIYFLTKLSYDIPDNIKPELIQKIFTKREIKNWEIIIKSQSEDFILKNIKNIRRVSSIKYKYKTTPSNNVIVDDESDELEQNEPEQNDIDIEL